MAIALKRERDSKKTNF